MVDDLISRQMAINRIDKQREHLQPDIYPQDKTGDVTYRICAEFIARLPSAQLEIIRCKDCKRSDWYTTADGHRYCYCMETDNGGRTEDDFCSYAERQEKLV